MTYELGGRTHAMPMIDMHLLLWLAYYPLFKMAQANPPTPPAPPPARRLSSGRRLSGPFAAPLLDENDDEEEIRAAEDEKRQQKARSPFRAQQENVPVDNEQRTQLYNQWMKMSQDNVRSPSH